MADPNAIKATETDTTWREGDPIPENWQTPHRLAVWRMRRASDRIADAFPQLQDACLAVEDSVYDFETEALKDELPKVRAAVGVLLAAEAKLKSAEKQVEATLRFFADTEGRADV
jgi:hypothetical protein